MSTPTQQLISLLRAEGHDVEDSEFSLEYAGLEISKRRIACHGGFIAWFETDNDAHHRVKIYHNAKAYFEWEPVTYNSAFGCYCGYLKYHAGVLVLIYKEKHEAYIVAIDQQEVRYITFNGEKFCAGDEMIYYQEYANMSNGVIGVITVPDLVVRPVITREELAVMNLEVDFI